MNKIPVVILCGGQGTRLREETEFKPKPMVEIGRRPILWHIMKIYEAYNYKSFILCLGYKSEYIKNYFLNYKFMTDDFVLDLDTNEKKLIHNSNNHCEWDITFAETGATTNTGGRIKRIKNYINSDIFFGTYGDGLSNIDINDLLRFHKEKGKIVTLTGVHPFSRFGIIEVDDDNLARNFQEKPQLDGFINGGFYVFDKRVFDYLDDDSVLEQEPLSNLARDGELAVYHHNGFWKCMDTYRDYLDFNNMWNNNNVLW